MRGGAQEEAAQPQGAPSWHQPGGVASPQRSDEGDIQQRKVAYSLLAIPFSSLLGLAIPTFRLDPLIVFRMWAANLWGSLAFAGLTFALMFYVLGRRMDRVESGLVVALGTAFLYIVSFSLSFLSLTFEPGFFDLSPALGRDIIMNVLYQGWPGILASVVYVDRLRARLQEDRPGVRRATMSSV